MAELQTTSLSQRELTPKELELQNALLLLAEYSLGETNIRYDHVSDIAYFGVTGTLLRKYIERVKNKDSK